MNQGKRRHKRRGYIRAALLILLLVMVVKLFLNIKGNSAQTVMAQYGEIRIQEQARGVVVRKEIAIKAPISGRISYLAEENIRIPYNSKLVEVVRERVQEKTLEKYREINKKIYELKDLGEQNNLLQGEVREIIRRISDSIQTGNLAGIYYEKERLMRKISYKARSQMDRLVEERDKLEQIIRDGVKTVFAPFSGIPIYSLDGYEEVLNPEHLMDINPLQLKARKVYSLSSGENVKAGQPVLKLVDNHCWYLVVQLSPGFAKELKRNSVVTLEFSDENSQEVKAKVKDLKEVDGNIVIGFEIMDYVPGMLKKRFMDVTIVKAKYSGYIIPEEALIHKNGSTWVQVLSEGKIVSKKVIVKGSDGTNAVISTNDKESQLKLYDRVIINPGKTGGSFDGH